MFHRKHSTRKQVDKCTHLRQERKKIFYMLCSTTYIYSWRVVFDYVDTLFLLKDTLSTADRLLRVTASFPLDKKSSADIIYLLRACFC